MEWARWRGAARVGGRTTSHVATLARSRGVPLLVGLRANMAELRDGEPAVLDAENGRLIVNPSDLAASLFQLRKRARQVQDTAEKKYESAPAVSAAGTPISVQINGESEKTLEGLSAASC